MSFLQIQHLLGLRGVSKEDIRIILDTAKNFREILDRPVKKVPSLRGVTVVNLFFENSTRTRISFELAEKRLSADSVNFTTSSRIHRIAFSGSQERAIFFCAHPIVGFEASTWVT